MAFSLILRFSQRAEQILSHLTQSIQQLAEANAGLIAATDDQTDAIRALTAVLQQHTDQSSFTGGAIVFIVKDDNPDVNYSITAPSVTDAEGNPIPDASLSYEVSSSDDTVVAITPNDPATTGSVHFGNPGQAAINVNVKSGDTLLGAFGANFTVTTGDPAAIVGGGISFEGLTDQ